MSELDDLKPGTYDVKVVRPAGDEREGQENYWFIFYEDQDKRPEIYTSYESALYRWQTLQLSWACHLCERLTNLPRDTGIIQARAQQSAAAPATNQFPQRDIADYPQSAPAVRPAGDEPVAWGEWNTSVTGKRHALMMVSCDPDSKYRVPLYARAQSAPAEVDSKSRLKRLAVQTGRCPVCGKQSAPAVQPVGDSISYWKLKNFTPPLTSSNVLEAFNDGFKAGQAAAIREGMVLVEVELLKQISAAFFEAAADISGWGQYAGDYFTGKHGLADDVKKYQGWQNKIDNMIAAAKERV